MYFPGFSTLLTTAKRYFLKAEKRGSFKRACSRIYSKAKARSRSQFLAQYDFKFKNELRQHKVLVQVGKERRGEKNC